MTKKLQLAILGVVLCITSTLHAEPLVPSPDQICLAQVIYHEAGNQPIDGQYAVGTVVMNRVRAGIGKTACEVVRQHVGSHWQFGSYTLNRNLIPVSRRDYFYGIARKVSTNTCELHFPRNVLYFNNKPFKSKKYKMYCVIGAQIFYTKEFSKVGEVAPLFGSHEILLHQNEMAEKDGLASIRNDEDLSRLIETGKLVPIPTSPMLLVDKRLPANRRFCRPWTANFLQELSVAYYNEFNKPIIVDSAVRTVLVQKRLIRINRNAASIIGDAASPHLKGIAVDINKRNFTDAELDWMRSYLNEQIFHGRIDVEEEFQQKCFHISVYQEYTIARVFND